jgi:hypothetical protein
MAVYVLQAKHRSGHVLSMLLQPVVVLIPFYNGSEAEGRAKFKAFLDIGTYT